MTEDFFGIGGSKMGRAGFYGAKKDEEVRFEQGFP